MAKHRWQLIITRRLDGATNMAIDHVLATTASPDDPPLLRLYDWQPPAISLGFHQDASEIDWQTAHRLGYEVVRRPTGGRAILHADEITYSVIIPAAHPLYKRSVGATYAMLSRCFQCGLQSLGLPLDFIPAARGDNRPARTSAGLFCFAASARHELKVKGKKILGSAQRRYPGAVLQHGSLLLGPAHRRLVDCVRVNPDEREWLRHFLSTRTTSLRELTSRPFRFEQVARAIQVGFEVELEAEFEPRELSAAELAQVERAKRMFEIEGGMGDAQTILVAAGGFADGQDR